MRNLILIALLSVVSSSTWADWVKVGITDHFTLYADSSTISKKGDMAKMWHLHDEKVNRKTVTRESYRSTKELIEYDCRKNMMRTLSFSLHSEKMGEGKVIYQDNFADIWMPVQAKTLDEILLQYACV